MGVADSVSATFPRCLLRRAGQFGLSLSHSADTRLRAHAAKRPGSACLFLVNNPYLPWMVK